MSKKPKKTTGSSRMPQIDPLLIARGMSSRYLSAKTPTISALSKDEIEKDLRHMEAYRNACIGYNQQFFVFKNQESVKGGTFGMFAPHPNGEGGSLDLKPASFEGSSYFAMPSKIDPEEEKRLTVLRKKISLSEFKREQLETEYLSLRAHYVHASQLVRKTRTYEFGRWKLLREVMERRGKVLGLMRVLVAMARDVEAAIVHRGKLLQDGADTGMNVATGATGAAADSATSAPTESKTTETGGTKPDYTTRNLYEMWTGIEDKLKQTEAACAQLETPSELLQMMISPDTPHSQQQNSHPTHNYSTRSPTKRNPEDDKKGRKRSSSVSTADESAPASSNGESKKSKGGNRNSLGPQIIPWDSMVEPSTPYGVPILLSCLSSATDKAVGYLSDIKDPKSITWFENSLPASTVAYHSDAEEVAKLTEEARLLEEEMNKEIVMNTELQKQIIKSRERNDQMVAMVQLLRTETEAALERHNTIMESPEARAKAAELHRQAQEAEKLKNPMVGEGDEEEHEEGENDGDIEENEVDSEEEESEGEVSNDEDENGEEEEREDVKIKEITVDGHSDGVESDEESEEGEIAEDEDMEEGFEEPTEDGPRKRGYDEEPAGDEESSSLTPPNQGAYRKRRRF